MDSKSNRERLHDSPDHFFFNEMKREIAEIAPTYTPEEYQKAADIVDVHQLGEVILMADAATPQEYPSIINRNLPLTQQLWKYMTAAMNEATQRRGYVGADDFRALTVSLSSGCIRVAQLLDTVKIGELGYGKSTAFTNAWFSSIAMSSAAGLVSNNHNVINEDSAKFATALTDEAFKKTAMERDGKSWSWAKTHVVSEALMGFLSLDGYLEELPEISTGDTEMLTRQNAELGEALDSLITFTPKPAIGSLEGTTIETLFVDQDVHEHTMISSLHRTQTNPVRLFAKGTLTSSNVELVRKHSNYKHGGSAKKIRVENVDGSVPNCEVIIYQNRQLTILGQPLMDFAKKVGKEAEATLLTSMLLGQKFDLTVPSYIVDLANDEAGQMPVDAESAPEADKLRRLLVARTRILKILGDEITHEMEKDEAESESLHKDIIKHGVVGHLRRIPEGYTASESARSLCWEQLGVEIPEGHTYVQKHERGNLDLPDKGHVMHKNPKAVGWLSLNAQ